MHYRVNSRSGLFWILLVLLLFVQVLPLNGRHGTSKREADPDHQLLNRMLSLLITDTAHAAAPLSDAGADRTEVKQQLLSSDVVLDGTGSFDPDGDPLTYQWYGPFESTTGPAPAVTIPEGRYTVSIIIDDGMTTSSPDTAIIEVTPCFTLTARAKDGKVNIVWPSQGSNILYEVYRSVASDPTNFTKIAETYSEYSVYADFGLVNYTTYLYLVKANLQTGSCYSSVTSAYPFMSGGPRKGPPVIYSSPITHGTTGIIYNYDVQSDAQSYTYTLTVYPTGMTIDPASGIIAWIPDVAGTFDVTVEVSDGQGGTVTQSYALSITAQPVRGPEVFICAEPFREQTPQPPQPDCAREEYATSYGLITGLVNERTLTVTLNGVVLPDGEEIYDTGSIMFGMRNGDFYWAFVTIPGVDGIYPITAVAWDALSNYSTATAHFIRDTAPPDIQITSPVSGSVVDTPVITITGVVDDPDAMVYEGFYGPPIPVINGVFEMEVTLDEGTNSFIFQAEDAAGNQGIATAWITLDTIPPQLDIISPVEGGAMNMANLAVSGLVIDENINMVTVSANGELPQPLTIIGQGFSGTVPLSNGWNALLFEATDQAGHSIQQTRTVLLDMLSPTVSITSPTSGASVGGIIQVTVEATDLQSGVSGVSLLIDGQPYGAAAQVPYTFDLNTMTYVAGAHTLTAQAIDISGNISETSIGINILPQVQLQLLSPLDGVTVSQSPLLVKGGIIHNLREVGVIINGVIAHVNGEDFAAEIYLQEGLNTITATATDGAGLEVTASINTTLIPEIPSLSLTAIPSSGIQPFEVTMEAETSIANAVMNYQWDIDGNGTIDTSGATLSTITNTYPNPGLYFPKVTVIDTLGNPYEESTVISVLSREDMDALLREKWTSMIDALNSGDTTAALTKIFSGSQASYQTMFSVLSEQLFSIVATAREFNLIDIKDNIARYKLLTTESGKTYSYEVIFIKDNHGLWKIKEF